MPRVERLPSGSYRIRYTGPDGRRISITAPTAGDVRARHRKALGDISRGEWVDPRRGRVTVASWAEDWLTGARNLSANGRLMYEQALAHILPELGRIPLGRLTAQDIDRYLAGKSKQPPGPQAATGQGAETSQNQGLAPSTVHRHYRTLHAMLAVAVDRGLIARNPCAKVTPPRVPARDMTVLSLDQVDALAAAITPRYRAWVYVAAVGGLRWSETVGLRRANVISDPPPVAGIERGDTLLTGHRGAGGSVRKTLDPAFPPASQASPLPTDSKATVTRIAVVDQLLRQGGGWVRSETKGRNRRVVTLPSFAADELKQHLDSFSQPGPDGLVFQTAGGRPMYGGGWHAVFRRALENAGLPPVRVHDLRHTAASLAIAAGAHPKAVQERFGHSSITVTYDRYGHLMDGADQAVATGLDELHAEAGRARLRVV